MYLERNKTKGKSVDEAPNEITAIWPHFNSMLFLKDTIGQRKLEENVAGCNDLEEERSNCSSRYVAS